MTWFEARRESHAVVPVERDAVWAVLTDPARLARLTPLVDSIEADGDHWHWKLSGLSVLGLDLAPAFTERMSFDPQDRIDFSHDPPAGRAEKAGSEGTYELSDADDGTSLRIDLTVKVDLPLPRLSSAAVRTAMTAVIAQMGNGFADRLATELDY